MMSFPCLAELTISFAATPKDLRRISIQHVTTKPTRRKQQSLSMRRHQTRVSPPLPGGAKRCPATQCQGGANKQRAIIVKLSTRVVVTSNRHATCSAAHSKTSIGALKKTVLANELHSAFSVGCDLMDAFHGFLKYTPPAKYRSSDEKFRKKFNSNQFFYYSNQFFIITPKGLSKNVLKFCNFSLNFSTTTNHV